VRVCDRSTVSSSSWYSLRVPTSFPSRPLIFIAHPDDETLACGGLLQRVPASLVVFATDGAAPGFGCERMFGSLKAYSDVRFQEASRALAHVPNASFQRMTKPDGSNFVELHLFEELTEASASLCALGRSFSPDAIISHAYEGAHIDHDTCSFLAMHAAADLSLMRFEVPLYWLDGQGNVVRQQFRDRQSRIVAPNMEGALTDILELQLSEAEIDCKKRMLAEYQTQRGTVSAFAPGIERMRPAVTTSQSFSNPVCHGYMYQERRPRFYHTRHHRLSANALLQKFAEFEAWHQGSASRGEQ
jgi:LmbE family N-acetylglucosaminyl deacetylase